MHQSVQGQSCKHLLKLLNTQWKGISCTSGDYGRQLKASIMLPQSLQQLSGDGDNLDPEDYKCWH